MAKPFENRALLDEVNAAQLWIRAKKVRPIWARLVDQLTRVQTLEGEEDVPVGAYLCRGEAGDVWPQTADTLNAKYVATEEESPDGWRKYEPNPDAAGVLAARINHAFSVNASWGELTGKPGDYLVKSSVDHETDYPSDVWIVDATLFAATYNW